MQLEVPDELYKDFLGFLDMAQASFTDEEITGMSENDQKVIAWVDTLLGETKINRFKTQEEYFANISDKFKKQIIEEDTNALEKA